MSLLFSLVFMVVLSVCKLVVGWIMILNLMILFLVLKCIMLMFLSVLLFMLVLNFSIMLVLLLVVKLWWYLKFLKMVLMVCRISVVVVCFG